MLQFTDGQVDYIFRERLNEFVTQLIIRARARHASSIQHLDDDALRSLLTREIGVARGIGLRTRSELERFTDLSIVFGAGFATELDWAKSLFSDGRLKPRRRLDKVEETAVFVARAR